MPDESTTLRLVWPQWQGAEPEIVAELTPELPFDEARRGYTVGTAVLSALLPPHDGPTAVVPVRMDDGGLDLEDGISAKATVVEQLGAALAILDEHRPERVVTLGGECSVSVAPFAELARRYGDDLAVLWVDSHPDVSVPASEYDGYHAMALAALTGHGAPEIVDRLPATVDPSRAALVGMHVPTFSDDLDNVAAWGISTFPPDTLRTTSESLLDWLRATGCGKVALHLDVDVVDSEEIVLGLGMEPGGLRTTEVKRILSDVSAVADVVALTVAEYIPRQVIRTLSFLRGLPMLDGKPAAD
ncbi:arginase family protein [Streptomyces sp. NPDC026672]|uniref:arginase family protein n=1 Tax=unclassified Streptomyces TaxID=2593676 RepID=UPI0033C390C1